MKLSCVTSVCFRKLAEGVGDVQLSLVEQQGGGFVHRRTMGKHTRTRRRRTPASGRRSPGCAVAAQQGAVGNRCPLSGRSPLSPPSLSIYYFGTCAPANEHGLAGRCGYRRDGYCQRWRRRRQLAGRASVGGRTPCCRLPRGAGHGGGARAPSGLGRCVVRACGRCGGLRDRRGRAGTRSAGMRHLRPRLSRLGALRASRGARIPAEPRRRRRAHQPRVERRRAEARRLRRGLPGPRGRGGGRHARARRVGDRPRLPPTRWASDRRLWARPVAGDRAGVFHSYFPPSVDALDEFRAFAQHLRRRSRARCSATRAGSSRTCGRTSTRSGRRQIRLRGASLHEDARGLHRGRACRRPASPGDRRRDQPHRRRHAAAHQPAAVRTPDAPCRGRGTLDVFAHHPYPVAGNKLIAPDAMPRDRSHTVWLANLGTLLEVFPGKPFYLTEFAYAAAPAACSASG